MKIGLALSCEENAPLALVDQAKRAEAAGFHALWISDHYHPWNDEQGHSPFVWSVIGAIAQATDLPIITAVTCPTVRIHPAVIAQAAATSAVLTGGRFVLGVGSGEALNEHIFGDAWPEADERLDMLEESIEIMRLLWGGGQQTYEGVHYRVSNARVYDLPDTPPPVYISGFGPKATKLAARLGDGYCTTTPDQELIGLYRSEGGKGPVQAGAKVCFGRDEQAARATAHRLWPNVGLPGELAQILPTPTHFEQAGELVTEDMVAETVPCGPDLDRHVEALREYEQAGTDELFVQQIGPEQDLFFDEWAPAVLSKFA
ncbi:TIGR03557 family F420-dependent LLM class oxidoreductase [Baekduia sp. Peel2402]|uniref:TIGR03557 family F420-dependent LLM class oxidoreductase n=1 Tax=Baekduia sp. Peel2402 TaxID=3458296 RepID=UPI00403E5903